jgi:pimeloyl-ACP methyl ester carboxylesterase
MINTFAARGYPPGFLYAVDMTPGDGDNRRAAEKFIAAGVERLLEQAQKLRAASTCPAETSEKVDVVAHSMGAVSARWFVRFGEPQRVRRFVALAGSNHGTDKLCGRSGRGDQQMCPAYAADTGKDAIQLQLNGSAAAPLDETPYGLGADPAGVTRIPPDATRRVAYFTVRLDPDVWIEPADSATLAGAGGIPVDAGRYPLIETSAGNYLFTANASHDGLPADPGLIRFVLELLRQ